MQARLSYDSSTTVSKSSRKRCSIENELFLRAAVCSAKKAIQKEVAQKEEAAKCTFKPKTCPMSRIIAQKVLQQEGDLIKRHMVPKVQVSIRKEVAAGVQLAASADKKFR